MIYEQIAIVALGTLVMFKCLLMQKSIQPITWQQLNAFKHEDMVKMTC